MLRTWWDFWRQASAKRLGVAFLLEALFLSAVILAYLAVFGNTPETYPDLVIEWTAWTGNNKSMEMHLVWLLVALTVALTSGIFLALGRRPVTLSLSSRFFRRENVLVTALFSYCLIYWMLQHQWITLFCCAAVLSLVVTLWKKERVAESVLAFLFCYYALFGLAAFVEWAAQRPMEIRLGVLMGIAFVVVLGLLKFRPQSLHAFLLRAQVCIPLGFFALFSHLFLYQGKTCAIPLPWRAMVFLFAVIAVCVYACIRKDRALVKDAGARPLDELVSLATCITIYALNWYLPNGLIHVTDAHHPIENIIGFSQIFELGQVPFASYLPISGMYSVVHGAFLYAFGDDLLANYGIATDIVVICLSGWTLFLLRRLLPMRYVLLVALFFHVSSYNRVWFILPVILLLLQPEILQRRTRMIVTWLLTSCFLGLYYPLYGAATCLGFLPVVLYHLASYRTARPQFSLRYAVPWVVTALVLLLATPLLYGMAIHMLAMSGQTVWADGIGAFAQQPDWFLFFVKWWAVRLAALNVLHFLGPMLPVAIGVWLLCRMFHSWRASRELSLQELAMATLMVSLPVISFSATFIRLDYGSMFARSTIVLYTAMLLFFCFVVRRTDVQMKKGCALLVAVYLAVAGVSPMRSAGSLQNFAGVPNDWVFYHQDFPHIGEGFLPASYDGMLRSFASYQQTTTPMFGISSFSPWYVLSIPGTATLEAGTIKGVLAVEEVTNILKAQQPVIGQAFDPYANYYLYHWILMSGQYAYVPEEHVFYPQDGHVVGDNQAFSSSIPDNRNFVSAPASLGQSMASLRKHFSDVALAYDMTSSEGRTDIVWDEKIDGDQADYLYVELEPEHADFKYGLHKYDKFQFFDHPNAFGKHLMMKVHNPDKTLRVSWLDDDGKPHAFLMNFGQGKILIPLGAGTSWLLHHHDRVTLECLENGQPTPLKAVNRIEFLKLRTVE